MTQQEQLKSLLSQVGIPSKSIEVYGSQIVVTCYSESAAEKWASVLRKFATVKRVALKSLDDAKVNTNTVMMPSHVNVWRTYATI